MPNPHNFDSDIDYYRACNPARYAALDMIEDGEHTKVVMENAPDAVSEVIEQNEWVMRLADTAAVFVAKGRGSKEAMAALGDDLKRDSRRLSGASLLARIDSYELDDFITHCFEADEGGAVGEVSGAMWEAVNESQWLVGLMEKEVEDRKRQAEEDKAERMAEC